ncbi:uncharacterized protein LOC102084684 isoform X3 [Columba livia]|uniref:uncharacterized protein LOC102084684 isoform X3 n=1 Tax=Columba livia TaxID=8932 RepID=UPI0031B9C678
MDPVASAIAGSIVGAASAATVAGVSLVMGNTGSISKKKMSEASAIRLESSSCLDEVMGNIVSLSKKKMSEASAIRLESSSCLDEKKMSEASAIRLESSSCLDEVMGNIVSLSKKKMSEASAIRLESSSCLDEVMGNTGSISKKKMSEASVMSLDSSSCPDEEISNTGSISRKKVLEASVMSLATSSCLDERKSVSLKFLFTKSIPGHGEIFEQVLNGTLQPGDILLFPLDGSNSTIAQALLRHAAVYCGNGEVIHFQGIDCKESPGVISKEGLLKMRKNRGLFDVYRKKDGVVLKEFNNRVRTAMNSEAKYDPYTNNCIHFALYLLGLQEFYSNLVRIQDEGDNSCSDTAARGRPIRDGGQAQQEPPPVDVGSGQGAEKVTMWVRDTRGWKILNLRIGVVMADLASLLRGKGWFAWGGCASPVALFCSSLPGASCTTRTSAHVLQLLTLHSLSRVSLPTSLPLFPN